jgi:Fe-S-cluster-containing dehydrogenase component
LVAGSLQYNEITEENKKKNTNPNYSYFLPSKLYLDMSCHACVDISAAKICTIKAMGS